VASPQRYWATTMRQRTHGERAGKHAVHDREERSISLGGRVGEIWCGQGPLRRAISSPRLQKPGSNEQCPAARSRRANGLLGSMAEASNPVIV